MNDWDRPEACVYMQTLVDHMALLAAHIPELMPYNASDDDDVSLAVQQAAIRLTAIAAYDRNTVNGLYVLANKRVEF